MSGSYAVSYARYVGPFFVALAAISSAPVWLVLSGRTGPVLLLLLVPNAAIGWLLSRHLVLRAELTADELVLRTPAATVRIPVDDVVLRVPVLFRWATVSRRGSLRAWYLANTQDTADLVDLLTP